MNNYTNTGRKVVLFLLAFLLLISQNAFSGELITLQTSENKAVSDLKRSRSAAADKSGSRRFGRDTIGLEADNTWQIKPGFEFKTVYDSNIHRERPHQRDEDIILNYMPSVEVRQKGAHLNAGLGYEMNFQQFLRETDESNFNHHAKADIKYTRERLKTIVNDKFAWATAYATSEQSERRTFIENDFSPEIRYRLTPKISAAAVYQNYLLEYKDSVVDEYSYMMNDVGGRFYYHATPKLDFYIQGTGTFIEYYRTDLFDSKGFAALIGAVGRVTPKLRVDLQSGYKAHFYDDSTINSYNTWVLQGILQYRLTPKLNAALRLKRDKQESVYLNTGWYEVNLLGLDFNYKIASHVLLEIDGSLQRNRYSRSTRDPLGTRNKKRTDYIFASGARIKWFPIRYLDFSVGYGFRERDSNFDNLFDYIDHTVDSAVSYKL